MAYIGKTPTVGNFQKCDALTASATADYTLQVSSTNVVPESVNHMIVSLNGIIQQPTTAYTVSGSTLSFASALTSNDTIDFVMLLGNVLDIGTPSDDTVTLAKMASGTDGNIISYDTSGNPVAVATGTDGQVLTSSGADAVCAFEDAPGGLSESDQWRITSDLTLGTSSAFITANLERVDTVFDKVGTGMSESSGVFSFPSTGIWLVMFNTQGLAGQTAHIFGEIFVTEDDSTYTRRASGSSSKAHGNKYIGLSCMVQVDVTDITNVKIKFGGYKQDTNAMNFNGSTDENSTCFTFIKLGDT